MKTKRTQKFVKQLKQKGAFDIPDVNISLKEAITDLVRSVMDFGKSDHSPQDTLDASIPAGYAKVLVSIATNAWRAKSKMIDATTGEFREEMKRVGRHVEAIYRNLAEVGVVIRDHTGDAYDEGQPMKVVASKATPGLDKKRVSETLLPSIFWKDRLIQNGEIEIETPSTPNAPAESHNPLT
jgi:hypothetical protein